MHYVAAERLPLIRRTRHFAASAAGAWRVVGSRSGPWFARSAAGPQLLDQDLAVASMAR